MKSIYRSIAVIAALLIMHTSFAQGLKKETIKVWGNCGMCKTTIEKAAKKAGATTASWNEDTKELKVSYKASNSSNKAIQKAIAKAGYDTQDQAADDKAYNGLHGCCQYERKPVVVEIKNL